MPEMPQASFLTLVATLASQATIQMGLIEHPLAKKIQKDLKQARYAIDLIATLQEKTRGNLTEEEKRVLERDLGELRMKYVEASK
jgi:hypothetical protein